MATVRMLMQRPLLRTITFTCSQASGASVSLGKIGVCWQSKGPSESRRRVSVTEVVYPKDPVAREGLPVVEIYTTLGCGLCDQAVEVLRGVKRIAPHTLIKQDITDYQVCTVSRGHVCLLMLAMATQMPMQRSLLPAITFTAPQAVAASESLGRPLRSVHSAAFVWSYVPPRKYQQSAATLRDLNRLE